MFHVISNLSMQLPTPQIKKWDVVPSMGLNNPLKSVSSQTTFIETDYRRIATTLPCPKDVERIVSCAGAVPDVNGYQTAVIWEKA